MHRLLSRQLKKCRTLDGKLDLAAFQDAVVKSYEACDRERYLANRVRVEMEADLRRAYERTWAEAERFLKTVLDTVGEGVVLCGAGDAILDVNTAVQRLFGYSAAELRGQPVALLIAANRRTAAAVEDPATFGVRKDGSRFPVAVASGDVAVQGGSQRVFFIRDIGDQVRLQRELAFREERFRDFAESSSDWFWETDENHAFTLFIGQYRLVSDVLQPSLIGRTRMDLMRGCCGEAEIAAHAAILEAHQPFRNFTYRSRLPDGGIIVLTVSGKPRFDDRGRFIGYRGTASDVTERHRLAEQLELAASVFANALEGIMITDCDGRILQVNKAFADITGYAADEAIGQTPAILKSHRHGRHFYEDMWSQLRAQGWWRGDIWNRRKSGELYLQASTISTIPGLDGRPKSYVAVFSDVTSDREKDERIRFLAHHDDLTGLANRRLLQDRVEHAVELRRREGGLLGLMFLDLDHFKYVNDSLGHEAGDRLLREAAERIAACVQRSDTVARMGGDEFVIVLDNAGSANDLAHLATELAAAMARPFTLSGQTVHVSASIGISLFPDDAGDAGSLMKNADAALYAAKLEGRNTFRFFNGAMNLRAVQRLTLEAELRRDLREGRFEMFYQPKIRLVDGRVDGVEALLRWHHPERGLLLPGEFIPVAEETGLIVDLGAAAFDLACRQHAAWRRRGVRVPRVAVNVSPVQLRQGDALVRQVVAAMDGYGLPGGALEVEVTETAVMTDPDAAIRSLRAIKATGIQIAIDDFGTGYSSLSSLRKLPIDTLKIDQSFVSDIERSDDDAGIVRMILGLGRLLGLETVAEGVESPGQEHLLAAWGCDAIQGFHYAQPLPGDDLEQWLAARRVAVDG